MAGINLPTIPRISDADLDDVKERRRIMNYLIKLDEQLRYMMTHLGEENFSQETVEAIRNGGASVESIRSLQTELGQATTRIEQNAQAITAKASQSSVDSLTGRVSSAETTLTLKADQATLVSTANDLQSQINAVPGEISLAVSNVSVGGRNLLLGTATALSGTLTGGTNQIIGGYTFSPYYRSSTKAGKQAVFSFDWSTTATSGTFHFQMNASPWTRFSITPTISSSSQSGHYSITLSMGDAFDSTGPTGIMCRCDNQTGTITIKNVKLEFGNKGTDWSPAPEDPSSGVINNSITIDTEGIKMSSSDVFQLVATNSSKQSFIDILGLFTVDKTGSLTAESGSYNSLTVGGQRVLTLSDIGIPIKVAANQPTGSNFIWLQPTGGGSVSSVRYTGYTAPSRNDSVNFGINNPISRSFASEDGVSTLSGSTYTYELEFEIYSLSSFTGVTFSATATKGGSTVNFAASSAITLNRYNHPVIKLTASSSVNLASSTSAITVAITATASPGRDGLFLQSQQNMTLTISTTNSGSGVQTCNVKYVP